MRLNLPLKWFNKHVRDEGDYDINIDHASLDKDITVTNNADDTHVVSMEFMASQEPLGDDFTQVLYDNLWELYDA